MENKLHITQVFVGELHEATYNPRKMTQKQFEDLTASIKEFGFVEPIIANANKDRFNIVIGGHQRLRVARHLGLSTVPVHYVDLDEKTEKKLNLRLNKNGGAWDWDKLTNEFENDMLFDVGFDEKDLGFDVGDIDESGNREKEVSFTVKVKKCPHCGGEL